MSSLISSSLITFQTKRQQPEFLTPARPTPQEKKHLSDIDIQGSLRFQVPFILSYKNDPNFVNLKDPVEVIRDALSRALVYYYPFAGRVREESNGRLYVDCNGEGILFIKADADVTLERLGNSLHPPCPYLEEFLFDVPESDGIVGTPVLLVQVTRLLCGGFIFALRMNHTMCDSYGLGQFLNAVAEMARGATQPTIPPVWERHILDARDPPRVTCTHLEYGDESETSRTGSVITSPDQPDLVPLCLYFGIKELTAARAHLSPTLTCSTFDLITACVWKCRTISLELDPEEVVRVTMAVNARGKRNNVSLPVGFYGNSLGAPCVITTAGLLCEQPLDYAVKLVQEAKGKMNAEYFQSCADLMATKNWIGMTMAGNNLAVSDNTRTSVVEVDFGWGKPVIAGPAKSVMLLTFYVRDNNQENEYGILVPICLPLSCVRRFEQEMRNLVDMPK